MPLSAFQKRSLENQEIIKEEQRAIKNLLLNVLEKLQKPDENRDQLFKSIPIATEKDLDDLNSAINDNDKFRLLVCIII